MVAMTAQAFAKQLPSPPATPAPATAVSADPYANNADGGRLKFPLAAAAGQNSNAVAAPPAGAINRGAFNAQAWQYGLSTTL